MSVAHRASVTSTEPAWVRRTLIVAALLFMMLFLVLPLAAVFAEAFRKGGQAYWEALKEPDAWSAIRLTLIVAAVAVPLNLVFGVAAAWAIAKYEFRGKAFLTTLVDLPFSVSPVVAGHIRGQTNTMPLHVEVLYNEYQSVAAFSVASLLALLAVVTLAIKSYVQWRFERDMKAAADLPPENPHSAPAGPVDPVVVHASRQPLPQGTS